MLVTQKNQYAIRAIYELARRRGDGPVKISDIAKTQAIPIRFLEVIMSQLKRSGWVRSKRGYTGGYTLVQSPDKLTIGDILRFMRESADPVCATACLKNLNCPLEDCAFMPLWDQVRQAVTQVYDGTTIQDLIDNKG